MKSIQKLIFILVALTLIKGFQEPAKAKPVTYKLRNGDTISGELLEMRSTNDLKVISHPYLGIITVKASSIVVPKVKYWTTNVEMGLDGKATTASSSLGYLLDVDTLYKDSVKELQLSSNYEFKRTSESGSKNITAVNKSITTLRYDKSLTNSWTSYFSTNYEYNALSKKGINDIGSSAGIAYKLIDNPKTRLRISAGPSIQWIHGGSNCSKSSECGNITPGSVFGANLQWSINEKLKLILDNKYNSTFISDSSISNQFLTSLKFYPSIYSDLYLSLSYQNIYDQIKEPSQEDSYKLKLGTSF